MFYEALTPRQPFAKKSSKTKKRKPARQALAFQFTVSKKSKNKENGDRDVDMVLAHFHVTQQDILCHKSPRGNDSITCDDWVASGSNVLKNNHCKTKGPRKRIYVTWAEIEHMFVVKTVRNEEKITRFTKISNIFRCWGW